MSLILLLLPWLGMADEFVNKPEWGDDESGKVVFMNDDHFADYRAKNDKFLAFFYAPWCVNSIAVVIFVVLRKCHLTTMTIFTCHIIEKVGDFGSNSSASLLSTCCARSSSHMPSSPGKVWPLQKYKTPLRKSVVRRETTHARIGLHSFWQKDLRRF